MINKSEFLKISENAVFDEPMSAHTTFKIGGSADVFCTPKTVKEIGYITAYCKSENIPYMFMGNGSNMLVSDSGIRGVVIQIGKNLSNYRIDGTTVYAEAGILMSVLANKILGAELTGFETLSGIPGTLGGGICMNAGAYGGEIKQILRSVTYLNDENETVTAKTDELELGYRHSIFSDNKFTVLSAVLELEKGNKEDIKAAMADYTKRRTEKQPLSMPSAGSVFKRPEGHFAGKLIQDCNLMGYSIGGAAVSDIHAGFIVNKGAATAADVLALIRHIQKTVKDKFGVELEPEVKLIGER